MYGYLLVSKSNVSAVVIGFNQVDYTIDEDAGSVQLSVSVNNGNIPEAESIIVTLNTFDGTAQCMYIGSLKLKFWQCV